MQIQHVALYLQFSILLLLQCYGPYQYPLSGPAFYGIHFAVTLDTNCGEPARTLSGRDSYMEIDTYLPLKIGHTTHALMQLVPINCPRETSKKNSGIPQVTRQTRNGMRKAPAKQKITLNGTLYKQHIKQ